MTATYFKARKAFDFNPNPFELGNILGLKMGYEACKSRDAIF